MNRTRLHELLRFGAIGVVNTGVYAVAFVVLHRAVPYGVAHVLAFALAVVGSFFLNCRFTFRVRPTWSRFLRFPLVNASTFLIMSVGVTTLVELLHVTPDLAALLSAVASVPLTFVVARLVLVGRPTATVPLAGGPSGPDAP